MFAWIAIFALLFDAPEVAFWALFIHLLFGFKP